MPKQKKNWATGPVSLPSIDFIIQHMADGKEGPMWNNPRWTLPGIYDWDMFFEVFFGTHIGISIKFRSPPKRFGTGTYKMFLKTHLIKSILVMEKIQYWFVFQPGEWPLFSVPVLKKNSLSHPKASFPNSFHVDWICFHPVPKKVSKSMKFKVIEKTRFFPGLREKPRFPIFHPKKSRLLAQ